MGVLRFRFRPRTVAVTEQATERNTVGKKWEAHQSRKFARQVEFNKPYYTVNDHAVNLAPWHDAQTYSVHVFTERAPITGNPMTAGGTSAAGLCQRQGPVYDVPPKGLRNIAGPAPQVAGPLPDGYEGELSPAEIRKLEKVVQGQKPRGSFWF